MKKLIINNTPKTPGICFDGELGQLEITGISVPENSLEFYEPIIDWIREYIKSPAKETVVELNFTFLNTSSLQCLYDLLNTLSSAHNSSTTLKVLWYYIADDIDMKEIGEDYIEALSLPIRLIEVQDVE